MCINKTNEIIIPVILQGLRVPGAYVGYLHCQGGSDRPAHPTIREVSRLPGSVKCVSVIVSKSLCQCQCVNSSVSVCHCIIVSLCQCQRQ